MTEGRHEGYERPTFDTDLLIGDRSLILFFPSCYQIITKIAIWMLASGRITKTRKTDIASKLRPSHQVTHQVLFSFYLAEWTFEYMFRTARFV